MLIASCKPRINVNVINEMIAGITTTQTEHKTKAKTKKKCESKEIMQ